MNRTRCCRFRITGETPVLTWGEAIAAAVAWRATGRREIPEGASDDGACPFLDSGGHCQIYEHRPLGCRTHFCSAAGGTYPRAHVLDAIRELEELDERAGADGACSLQSAVRAVWGLVCSAKKRKLKR